MASLSISPLSLIQGAKVKVTPLLHVASFLLFVDLWTHLFYPIPLLKWDFSSENIPSVFCLFVFLALIYAILFRLVQPILLLILRENTVRLFQGHNKTEDEISGERYGRYAAETGNSTAYKVMEESRSSSDRSFWTLVLISLSLLLFSLDAALCRSTEGTVAHWVLPPKITSWIPVWGFLAYAGFLLGWCINGWGYETSRITVTQAIRKEIEQRERGTGLRSESSESRMSKNLASGGGPERGPG